MVEAIIYFHNHIDGAGYYFFDETWSSVYGPYEDRGQAEAALERYVNALNAPKDAFDWGEQFEEAKKGELVQPPITDAQREAAWSDEKMRVPSERVVLDHITDLYNLEGLIDGGYLTFVYGSRKGNFGGWDTQKFKYGN